MSDLKTQENHVAGEGKRTSTDEPHSDPEKNAPSAEDPNVLDDRIVDFDGDGDMGNPLNWKKSYRWFLVILLSFMTTMVYVSFSHSNR